jgi:hypothetical protein
MVRNLNALWIILFILNIFFTPATLAQANANQRAEAEARSRLPKCQQPKPDVQQLCLKNQQDFIREYVRAKAGSQINIRGIASYLTPVSPKDSDFEKSPTFPLYPRPLDQVPVISVSS